MRADAMLDKGDLDGCAVFKRVLEITPHVSATGIRSAIHFGKSEDLQRYIDGMRKAGLPE